MPNDLKEAAGQLVSGEVKEAAGYVIASLFAIATGLPKLLNYIKGEGVNGSVLTRLAAMEKHAAKQDRKIHKFAVRTTKLCVAMLRLEGLLIDHNIPIPDDLSNDLAEIKRDADGDEDDEVEDAK